MLLAQGMPVGTQSTGNSWYTSSTFSRRVHRMIREVIKPREADIGGLIVRRSLPKATVRSVGPWVFFDHMGPADFRPGKGLDVIPHPHINLATVTYLFEGEIIHRDSLGNVQAITPGAINLMVAGKGIVHSERTGDALRSAGHQAHGLQLWLALPEETEESEPAFYHYPASDLPRTDGDGIQVRVMIGSAFGLISPVKTLSPTLYAESEMTQGSRLSIPANIGECAVYLVSGAARVDGTELSAPSFAVLGEGAQSVVHALAPSKIVVVAGAPLGKRYMWWNFVSSRKERIEQAMDDWQRGGLGKVPNETEAAPLPSSDSFSSMKE